LRRLKMIEPIETAYKIEGLRYTLYSIGEAFKRIQSFCDQFDAEANCSLSSAKAIEVLTYCWAVIDQTNRARALAGSLPPIDGAIEERRIFLRETASTRNLRNILHHYDQKIAFLPIGSSSLFGSLSWKCKSKESKQFLLLVQSGAVRETYPTLIFDTFEGRFVSDFVFNVADKSLSLLNIDTQCRNYYNSMDSALEIQGLLEDAPIVGAVIGSEMVIRRPNTTE